MVTWITLVDIEIKYENVFFVLRDMLWAVEEVIILTNQLVKSLSYFMTESVLTISWSCRLEGSY